MTGPGLTWIPDGDWRGPTGATGAPGTPGERGATGPAGSTTLRGATDYDNSVAPTDGQAVLWVPSAGKFAPRSVLLASQRDAPNGVAPLDANGLVPIADLPVGSAASTVARGDHGVPAGGATGALLVKRTAGDYDDDWVPRGITQMRATAAQTLSAANTFYPVAFAAEDFDDDGAHNLTTNNSRFTATRAGLYRVSGSVIWVGSQSTTNPQRLVQLTRSGTVIPGSRGNDAYVATGLTQRINPMFVSLAVGQYIDLQVSSAAAGAQLYASTTDGYGSLLVVELIR